MLEIKNVKIIKTNEYIKQYLKEHPGTEVTCINPEKEYIGIVNYLKLRQ